MILFAGLEVHIKLHINAWGFFTKKKKNKQKTPIATTPPAKKIHPDQ